MNFAEIVENSCPKCSITMLSGSLEDHIAKCKSTAIDDGVKTISNWIDKEIMDSLVRRCSL